jgi:hypothetical protein
VGAGSPPRAARPKAKSGNDDKRWDRSHDGQPPRPVHRVGQVVRPVRDPRDPRPGQPQELGPLDRVQVGIVQVGNLQVGDDPQELHDPQEPDLP